MLNDQNITKHFVFQSSTTPHACEISLINKINVISSEYKESIPNSRKIVII